MNFNTDWLYFSDEIGDISKTFSAFRRINAALDIDADDYDVYNQEHKVPLWSRV